MATLDSPPARRRRGPVSTPAILTLLILLSILVYLAPSIFITLGPGEAGVLWKRFGGGTVTVAGDGRDFTGRIHADAAGEPVLLTERGQKYEGPRGEARNFYPYTEGMRVIFPWDRMYIYNIRLQEIDHSYSVLTSDGLNVQAQISIRWKPIEEDLGKLHRDIGPDYVDTLIVPTIGAYAREEIARYPPEALYSQDRLAMQEAIRVKTRQALKARFYPERERESYFIVESVLIRDVVLPETVRAAIQEKVLQKQMAEAYDYRLVRERKEAERKAIEAEGIRRFQEAINGSISERYLKWKGIDATLELAKSNNSKVVVIGAPKDGLPIILGGMEGGPETAPAPPPR